MQSTDSITLRNTIMQDFDIEKFERLYHENMSLEKTRKILGYSRKFVDKMAKEKRFEKIPLKGRCLTKEQKVKVAMGVSKYLKENCNGSMFYKNAKKSAPCEYLKSILKENGFDFVEEYQCFKERNFLIDIAFPSKKICFEVNGCFHYDNNGKLKPYYQERHNFIISKGWNIIEIPHMMVYNKEYAKHLISILNDNGCSEDKYEDLKQELIRKQKEKHICPACGGEKKTAQSKLCDNCRKNEQIRANVYNYRKNRLLIISINELIKTISGKNMTQIAKEFGTNRSIVVKVLRKRLPNYKEYINVCNSTKDLSYLSDKQLTSDLKTHSVKSLAIKYNTTQNHVINEFKKRNISIKQIKLLPIPQNFDYKNIPLRELAKKYGVDRKVIKRWIRETTLIHPKNLEPVGRN